MASTGEDLPDYEEDIADVISSHQSIDESSSKKGTYSGIHSSGFRDFLLKPELLRAINDCGFENPSEVQHEAIPQAILGTDLLCQAKSGMGKTAVFVLAVLQQIDFDQDATSCVVLCHTRELAYQICDEFQRFSRHFPKCRIQVFFGGLPIAGHKELLAKETPHIVVGTPGRMLDLHRQGDLKLGNVKYFIIDECDHVLGGLDMRQDVQEIFKATPHKKQVMMFTATLSQEMRRICKMFMQDLMEIVVEDDTKLTLHGLLQYVVDITDDGKNQKLVDLLDALEFNQVVIFVSKPRRALELNRLLESLNFPSIAIYGGLKQEERLKRFKAFRDFDKRILVSTDLTGRGIDIERVNIVINYDMPDSADQYLHRVGRAGRFGTKGLAISFLASEADRSIRDEIEKRFDAHISALPDQIDVNSYMTA